VYLQLVPGSALLCKGPFIFSVLLHAQGKVSAVSGRSSNLGHTIRQAGALTIELRHTLLLEHATPPLSYATPPLSYAAPLWILVQKVSSQKVSAQKVSAQKVSSQKVSATKGIGNKRYRVTKGIGHKRYRTQKVSATKGIGF